MEDDILLDEAGGAGEGLLRLGLVQGLVGVGHAGGETQAERVGEGDPLGHVAVEHVVIVLEVGGRTAVHEFLERLDGAVQVHEHAPVHLFLGVVGDVVHARAQLGVRDGAVGVGDAVHDGHLQDVAEGGVVGVVLPEGVQLGPRSHGADESVLEQGLGPAVGHEVVFVGLVETAVGSGLIVGEDVAREALHHLVGSGTILVGTVILVGRKHVGDHLGDIGTRAHVVVVHHLLVRLLLVGIARREVLDTGNQAKGGDGKDESRYLFHNLRPPHIISQCKRRPGWTRGSGKRPGRCRRPCRRCGWRRCRPS